MVHSERRRPGAMRRSAAPRRAETFLEARHDEIEKHARVSCMSSSASHIPPGVQMQGTHFDGARWWNGDDNGYVSFADFYSENRELLPLRRTNQLYLEKAFVLIFDNTFIVDCANSIKSYAVFKIIMPTTLQKAWISDNFPTSERVFLFFDSYMLHSEIDFCT